MLAPHSSPKLIAIDMDGTLLGSNGRVSERNIAALRSAEAAGVEIVIATGRRHAFAMRVLRELNLRRTSALVSSNGTVIRTIGSAGLLHRSHIPLSTARWLCDHVAEFRSTLVLTFDTVGEDGDDSRGALVVEETSGLYANMGRWMQSNEPYIAHVPSFEEALQGDPPTQMMLCGPIAHMRRAEALLAEHPLVTPIGADSRPDAEIALHRTEYPDHDLCIIDILPAGCSKASALQHLAELRGISMQNVLAIGDNWNDVPMLDHAGQAVLMSNAPEDLKQIAGERGWTIGPSNDEDGVAVAIEAALEITSTLNATEKPLMVV
jgi:hydroxymethylpyrimidine pyrophosphatase-like HAD family hydrolase